MPSSSFVSSSHGNQSANSDDIQNASKSNDIPDVVGMNGGVINFYNKKCYYCRMSELNLVADSMELKA
ncbi:hypothetical protein WN944_018774 [Citrus x changshan-huyou]|uniref:Uncharacterized protein n=1 Tax=Citrus x changshan-huyou TaxID=2935761 RepID=A0AAP0LU94_9ROSI